MNEIPISYHRKTAFLDILHSMMFTPPFRHVEKGMELLCQGVQYKYLTQKEKHDILTTTRALIQSEMCSSKSKTKLQQLLDMLQMKK